MTPYLLLFLVLLFLSLVRGWKERKVVAMLVFAIMMFLCGWRGVSVGVDTISYWQGYKSGSERMEPLFQLIMYICHWLGLSPKGYTMTVALITYLPLGLFIRKKSLDISFSVLVFFCFSVYFFHETFNTIRVCAAVMYALWSYYYLEKKKFLVSFFFLIVAFLLHYSTVVIIPFVIAAYFIKHIGYYTMIAIVFISVVFGLLFEVGYGNAANEIVAMGVFQYGGTSEWFQHYLENIDETSFSLFGSLTTMLPFSFFAIAMYDKINARSIYFKLFIFAVLLQNVFVSLVFTYRIAMFFTTLLVVVLPNSFVRAKGVRKLCLLGLSAFMVMWYVYLLLVKTDPDRLAGTIPYTF